MGGIGSVTICFCVALTLTAILWESSSVQKEWSPTVDFSNTEISTEHAKCMLKLLETCHGRCLCCHLITR